MKYLLTPLIALSAFAQTNEIKAPDVFQSSVPGLTFAEVQAKLEAPDLWQSTDTGLTRGVKAGEGILGSAREYFTVIGPHAGERARNARRATLIGFEAGVDAVAAQYSVMVGTAAGAHSDMSWGQTFLGYAAGRYARHADESTFIGGNAGRHATNSSRSVFLGGNSGISANGTELTFIGYGTGQKEKAYTRNSIAIGSCALVSRDNQIVIGDERIQQTVIRGKVLLTGSPPKERFSPGEPGEFCVFEDYIYLCIKSNDWRRLRISGSSWQN